MVWNNLNHQGLVNVLPAFIFVKTHSFWLLNYFRPFLLYSKILLYLFWCFMNSYQNFMNVFYYCPPPVFISVSCLHDTLNHWGLKKKRNRNLFRKIHEKFEAVCSEYVKYSSEENVQTYFKRDENYFLTYQKRAEDDCFLT